MVLESVLVSFFYKWLTSFPAPFVKEIVFNALYILASVVEDNRCVDLSILWAFYFVPLIYISVFVPVPYCLDDCGFVVEPEVRQVDSFTSILLNRIVRDICTPMFTAALFIIARTCKQPRCSSADE